MKITQEEMTYLAKEFKEHSPLSMLSNLRADLAGKEADSLEKKGILKDGALQADAREILEVIAGAEKSARLIVQDKFVFSEKYVYRKADKYVLVENDSGELSVKPILNFENVLFQVSEFSGMSRLKTTDIALELEPEEFLTLMAVLDEFRANTLRFHGGCEEIFSTVKPEKVAAGLEKPINNGLVKMLVNNYDYKVPAKDKIKGILDGLIKKGLMTKGYGLNDDLEIFSRSFLVPETVILIELLAVDGSGEVIVSGSLAMTAGIKEIAFFIMASDIISLNTVSGKMLMEVIENFLSCPDLD